MPSDLEIEIANLNRELARAKANAAKMKRATLGLQKRNEAKLQAAEKDLNDLLAQPASPLRDAKIYFARLGVEGAKNALEMVQILEPLLVPDLKDAARAMKVNMARIDTLGTQARYIGIERYIVTYKDKINLLDKALNTEAPAAEQPAKSPTGPLAQRGLPGPGARPPAPGLRPGVPPRPGAGPLAQRAAQMQQNRGIPPRPGQPGAAPGGRTGPLSAAAAAGSGPLAQRAGGTGPLAQRAQQLAAARGNTAPLKEKEQIVAEIRAAVEANPALVPHLKTLLSQFQEIDMMLEPLRQGEPGKFDMPSPQAEALLNGVSGKIYYLKRTVQNLGPLAATLAFDEAKAEEGAGLESYLDQMETAGAEATAAAQEEIKQAAAQRSSGSVMDQLRSILKSK